MIRAAEDILKPSVDQRSYRYVELQNGMKCLLVFDESTEKSAACCSVQVGSMSDPVEAQGLAHFLEHMLFMGTEKYPEENAYSAFLNNHGGGSNAYTAQENTVYYFDVQSEHFAKALDLFSSFFTCPLFTESGTSREINAVDSENSKNLQSDSWRKYQLFKSMARGDHPLVNFSTGNLQTLGEAPAAAGTNIRDMMIAFYKQFYSANMMNLVVYSSLPLNEQQSLVENLFLAVPDQKLSRPEFPADPFGPSQLKKFVEICPVRDIKTLDLLFPVPASDHLYQSKPNRYLAHLFGHESDGSILSALKKQLWANNLSSFKYQSCKDFACFAVSIELSDEGMKHIPEIIAVVFAYAGMLLRLGPQPWVLRELKEVADMQFRFQDKTEPQDYVVTLATGMDFFEPQHVIAGETLFFTEDLSTIAHFLSFLTPENCLVFLQHKGCEGKVDLKEKWYGTPHGVRQFNAEEKAAWSAAYAGGTAWDAVLALPQPNPFIPTDFSLKPLASEGEKAFPGLVSSAVHPFPLTTVLSKQAERRDATVELEANSAKSLPSPSGKKGLRRQSSEPGMEMVDMTGEEDEADDDAEEEEEEYDDEEEVATPAAPATGDDTTASPQQWLKSLGGESVNTWHRLDGHWSMPKANVTISLETQFASCSAWNAVLTDLLSRLLSEILNEFSYYADCAGLYQQVSLAKGGLTLNCSGYGHKLPVLVERTIHELQRLGHGTNLTLELFSRVKEKTVRAYKNELYGQPYRLAMVACSVCLEDPRYSLFEKLQALTIIDMSSFLAFTRQFLAQMRIELLVNGNMHSDEARELTTMLSRALPQTQHLPYMQEPLRRAVQLEMGKSYAYRESALTYNPAEVNSAVTILYLLNTMIAGNNGKSLYSEATFKEQLRLEAMESLVVRMLSEPAFDQLRTKEQLGYIVFVTRQRVAQHGMNITFIVQSKGHDPVHLDQRVEAFLLSYREVLTEMTEEALQTLVQAEKEKLLEKPKNLDEESGNFWGEVSKGTYLFDRHLQLHAALSEPEAFTVQTVQAFYDTYLMPNGARRCKFSSQFFGKDAIIPSKDEVGEGVIVVEDPALFKRHLPLLPMPRYL